MKHRNSGVVGQASKRSRRRNLHDKANRELSNDSQPLNLAALNSDLNNIREEDRPKRRRRNRQRRSLFRRVLRYGFILGAVGLVVFAFRLYLLSNQVIKRNGAPTALALQEDIDPSQVNKEGDGRVNILLIGVGGDGHQGGALSDTILVASIDPIAKDVAMLSIPRDLYVAIPGYWSTRINAAHAFGEQDKVEGGGPALLTDTLEDVLDIDIHYYARADFKGFVEAVDIVGGIDVKVEETLYDSSYPTEGMGGTEVFHLEAGEQHLNGKTALKYVRCRKGTCGDDYGRAARQQQALISLKDKALSLGVVSSPTKVTGLLNTIGNHAQTNLGLTEITRLIEISQEVDSNKIETTVLDTSPESFLAGQNIGGAAVLVPRAGVGNYLDIQKFIRGYFIDGFIRKEKPTVTVLNGSLKAGLATETAELLESYGYKVKHSGDAPTTDYITSRVIFSGDKDNKKPFTAQYLSRRFNSPVEDKLPKGVTADTDFVIILGSDYAQ